MRIDSHHHLWTIQRGDYDWLTPDLGSIYRDFTMSDLAPHLKMSGIGRTIVVQAAPTIAETEFLLETAAHDERIAGVVGWINMEAPDAVSTLTELARYPKFCGIRPMIQNIEDRNWILRDSLNPVFAALVELDLCFDALVRPRHLQPLFTRLLRNPALRCVIDHGGKPDLSSGDIDAWKDDIKRIVSETNSYCKLSGLLTEADDQPSLERILPAGQYLLESFGPERVMFGSDWPVLNLAGDYAGWSAMVEQLLRSLAPSAAEQVWGGAARRFYLDRKKMSESSQKSGA